MLDFATFPGAENVTSYSAADPVQLALRARLTEMTEAELDAIERGIQLYQRDGFVSRIVGRILDDSTTLMAA